MFLREILLLYIYTGQPRPGRETKYWIYFLSLFPKYRGTDRRAVFCFLVCALSLLHYLCFHSVLLPVLIQELCHYWIICIRHINDCPFKFHLGFVLSFFFQLLHCSIEHICMNVEHKGQSSDYSFLGYQIFVCPDC